MSPRRRRLRRIRRGVLVTLGLLLIPVGLIGVLLPTHLLGVFLILGLILVLRNSVHWRRRFVRLQRRHPRFVYPIRRVLRGEVWPVLWHEALRTERWIVPRPWRRLKRWRRGLRLTGRRLRPA